MSSAARVTEAAEVVDLATRRRLVTPSAPMRPRCEQFAIGPDARARRCRRRARWRLTTPSRAWAVCDACRAGALAVLTARGVVGVEAV